MLAMTCDRKPKGLRFLRFKGPVPGLIQAADDTQSAIDNIAASPAKTAPGIS